MRIKSIKYIFRANEGYKIVCCAQTIKLTCYSTACLFVSINASHALLFSHLSLSWSAAFIVALFTLIKRSRLSDRALVCCCYFAQAMFADAQKVKLQMYLQLSAACLVCSVTTHGCTEHICVYELYFRFGWLAGNV